MADDGDCERLRVLSRTTGPPCSNICTFQVDALPGWQFCAYAVTGGPVVVHKASGSWQAHTGGTRVPPAAWALTLQGWRGVAVA